MPACGTIVGADQMPAGRCNRHRGISNLHRHGLLRRLEASELADWPRGLPPVVRPPATLRAAPVDR